MVESKIHIKGATLTPVLRGYGLHSDAKIHHKKKLQ